MNISKKRYIQGFCLCVIALAAARAAFPGIARDGSETVLTDMPAYNAADSTEAHEADIIADAENADAVKKIEDNIFFNADGSQVKHPIYSVTSFRNAFPDLNDIQLEAAERHGVKPVADRKEAENRKSGLVYVASNPYFYVQPLKSSIPYLVPRASILLQDIGRNFYDSLTVKDIPLHKIIVTSIMRTQEDIGKLVRRNRNASSNSCHVYGTTFDIAYNRYKTVCAPDGPQRRLVRDDTLKWVLSEVLNDMRKEGRCYVKYEVHQGCFHITTR